jgi:hypothetical protein
VLHQTGVARDILKNKRESDKTDKASASADKTNLGNIIAGKSLK